MEGQPTNVQAQSAQARWELENDVQAAGPADLDALYSYDPEEQKAIQAAKPWTRDPHYFKRCAGRGVGALGVCDGCRTAGDHTPWRRWRSPPDRGRGPGLPPLTGGAASGGQPVPARVAAVKARRHCSNVAVSFARLLAAYPPLLVLAPPCRRAACASRRWRCSRWRCMQRAAATSK